MIDRVVKHVISPWCWQLIFSVSWGSFFSPPPAMSSTWSEVITSLLRSTQILDILVPCSFKTSLSGGEKADYSVLVIAACSSLWNSSSKLLNNWHSKCHSISWCIIRSNQRCWKRRERGLSWRSTAWTTDEFETIGIHRRRKMVVVSMPFVRKCCPKYLCGVILSTSLMCLKISV